VAGGCPPRCWTPERGEQFVITRHGRPAARLGPAAPASEPPASGRWSRLAQWARERRAFERLRPMLRSDTMGGFVAVHRGAVVDTDPDPTVLFERVARTLGGEPFFIGRVGAAEPVVDLPGFSIE
jgi:antitoxin (DNA-binding transcriptional repressor) of toxin-antitoxin stability system